MKRKVQVARRLKRNESTIRTIFSNKDAIKASVKAFGTGDPSTRLTVTPKCVVVMEKLLEEFIRQQEKNSFPVTVESVRDFEGFSDTE